MGIEISQLSQSAQRQALQKNQKASKAKYGNVKTQRVVGGKIINFDSKKEAERYDILRARQLAGSIRNLKLQPEFNLQAAFTTLEGERVRAIRYLADFSYEEPFMHEGERFWRLVVEDVKTRATRTPEYQMKRKMMQDRHGIEVQEK